MVWLAPTAAYQSDHNLNCTAQIASLWESAKILQSTFSADVIHFSSPVVR